MTDRPDSDGADLDTVAEELYGLEIDEFIATRSRYEKQARQAGDRELADQVRALAKPNQAAWLVNQLARRHGDELQPLLELGAGLREATRRLAGDELRQLSRQQHELVYALVQQARTLGRASGHKVSDDTARGVDETLHAALVDEAAAEVVLAGRLTTPLHRSGFGDSTAEPSMAPRPRAANPAPTDRAERRRAEAQRALDAATRARDDARDDAEHATQSAEGAKGRVDQLRADLEEATAAATDADKRRRERDGALRRAERAVADAERRLSATAH